MNSIKIRVSDFNVEYKQSEYSTDVKIYVNGFLNEDRQPTWYLRELLDEAIYLQDKANKWQHKYSKLIAFARKNIDKETLDSFLNE